MILASETQEGGGLLSVTDVSQPAQKSSRESETIG